MRLEKITSTYGQTYEVNLDCIGSIEKRIEIDEITIGFPGMCINVNIDEFNRIMSLIENKTDELVNLPNQIKEIIYKATYLDSNAKLQLIMELENIL